MRSIDVYIAYDMRDTEDAAALHRALTARGMTPWAEVVDVTPGQLWDEVIPWAISQSKVVAVLITDTWPARAGWSVDFYGAETVALAIELARRVDALVVPVLLGDVGHESLPYGLRGGAVLMGDARRLDDVAAALERIVASARDDEQAQSNLPWTGTLQAEPSGTARDLDDAGDRLHQRGASALAKGDLTDAMACLEAARRAGAERGDAVREGAAALAYAACVWLSGEAALPALDEAIALLAPQREARARPLRRLADDARWALQSGHEVDDPFGGERPALDGATLHGWWARGALDSESMAACLPLADAVRANLEALGADSTFIEAVMAPRLVLGD